jgi:2-dehydropantoate 2-reductase
MRILVAGTGALACVYAARLVDPGGHDVVMVGTWPEQLQAIAQRGITINHDGSSATVSVNAYRVDDRLSGPFDLVLVATKSYQLADRIGEIRDLISRETAVFGIQNGLTPWKILTEALAGAGTALAGESMVGATKAGLGVVDVHLLGETLLAAVDSRHAPVAERAAEIISTAGMPVRALPTEQLTELLWQKAILACALGPLCVILRAPVSAIHASPAASRVALGAMQEVQGVAATLGITLDAKSSFDGSAAFGANRPSTLADFLVNRPSEVPDLNGALVEYAETQGVEAPINRMLSDLVGALYETAGERIS